MRSTWIIRVTVVLIVVALGVWIARNTYWDEVEIPMPAQGEAATNPFYAQQHLVETLGARSLWQRVPGAIPPPQGVLVLSNFNWNLIDVRRERIQKWVEAGGRLVIDRSVIGGEEELTRWTGISRYSVVRRKAQSHDKTDADARNADHKNKASGAKADDHGQARPNSDTDDDDDAENPNNETPEDASGSAGPTITICGFYRYSRLQSARKTSWTLRSPKLGVQAMRVALGKGSVTLVNSRPFTNSDLLRCQHGLLFTRATQLHRGDDVWFVTEDKGPSLLTVIWTTAAPVVLVGLALIALWLWRAGVRFGPIAAPTDPARRSLAEQILGTGQFTVRIGGGSALHAAAARALLETADRRIPGFARLGSEERVAAIARLASVDASELAAAINRSGPQHANELRHRLALLESVRRVIAQNRNQREGSRHAD
jgi:hypothetical protein